LHGALLPAEMKLSQLDLNTIRAMQVLTILSFAYLAYWGHQNPFSSGLLVAFQVLPTLPFVLAFVWLIGQPSALQWTAIRTTHQALAIVVFAVCAILLVGLPDTAIASQFLAVLGVMQLVALVAIRRAAGQTPRWRWQSTLRLGLIVLFGVVLVSLK